MLIIRTLSRSQVGYYLEGPSAGRWTGTAAHRLGLNPAGPVTAGELTRLLAGRDPAGGRALTTLLRHDRRDGWDLTFAAPKSVSLLAALADPDDAASVVSAHHCAVGEAVGYLERHACHTRRCGPERTPGQPGPVLPAVGLVAASYTHHHNWLEHPHLHDHVLVANLALAEDGRWSALDGRQLYRQARTAGCLYQAGLRHHFRRLGIGGPWRLHPNGLADLAGVPRAAIDVVSRRTRQVVAAGGGSARQRRAAAGRTRRPGPAQAWEPAVARAGFDRNGARALAHCRPGPASLRPDALASALAPVADRGTTFSPAELIAALATQRLEGAPAEELEADAERLLRDAVAVGAGRYGSRAVGERDRATVDRVLRGARLRTGLAAAWALEGATEARPHLDTIAVGAVGALTRAGAPVSVLGAAPLLAQVAVLDAARAAWEATGHRVVVVGGRDLARGEGPAGAARRWRALAGFDRPGRDRPTVVVIEAANALPGALLAAELAGFGRRGAKVVLIESAPAPSGTRAGNDLVGQLARAMGVIEVGNLLGGQRRVPATVFPGPSGDLVVGPSALGTVGQLIDDWARMSLPDPCGPKATAETATMVALGPAEVEALNIEARRRLEGLGLLVGPELRGAGRSYQVGDQVRALRVLPGVRAGATGRVVEVHRPQGALTVAWGEHSSNVGGRVLERLGYAYATTAAFLPHLAGPVLVLGWPEDLSADRRPGTTRWYLCPPRLPAPPPATGVPRRVEDLALVAEALRSPELLRAMGPLPDERTARRVWRAALPERIGSEPEGARGAAPLLGGPDRPRLRGPEGHGPFRLRPGPDAEVPVPAR